MNLTIHLPDSLKLFFNHQNMEKEIKKSIAIMLYLQEKISLSKAAELSEIDIYSFIYECKINQIPVIDYSEEEINEELVEIRKRLK
ncbi:MAG: hypothetical protein A2Y41_06480 [Spirochaetes bacterium GWB1_36_13]|nr:MAG: hypothetical protein A2Y41_06480 [Spirochaetes bacterium GWB1_36_13]